MYAIRVNKETGTISGWVCAYVLATAHTRTNTHRAAISRVLVTSTSLIVNKSTVRRAYLCFFLSLSLSETRGLTPPSSLTLFLKISQLRPATVIRVRLKHTEFTIFSLKKT